MKVYEFNLSGSDCKEWVLAHNTDNAKEVLVNHCGDFQDDIDHPDTTVRELSQEESDAMTIIDLGAEGSDDDGPSLTLEDFLTKHGTGEPMHLSTSEF